jgi:hypothetical protein
MPGSSKASAGQVRPFSPESHGNTTSALTPSLLLSAIPEGILEIASE